MAYSVVQTVAPAQNADGGFGGGHGQVSHCAPSYAAILSLAMVGGSEALDLIDRRSLYVHVKYTSTTIRLRSVLKMEMAGDHQAV